MSAKKPTSQTPSKKAPRAKRARVEGPAAPRAEAASAAQDPTLVQVRTRAYEIYRSGANPRDPVADWFQAERELRNGSHA